MFEASLGGLMRLLSTEVDCPIDKISVVSSYFTRHTFLGGGVGRVMNLYFLVISLGMET